MSLLCALFASLVNFIYHILIWGPCKGVGVYSMPRNFFFKKVSLLAGLHDASLAWMTRHDLSLWLLSDFGIII